MLSRRRFLSAGLTVAALASLGCTVRQKNDKPLISVARDDSGQHAIHIFSSVEEQCIALNIPARAHDVEVRPGTSEVVVFDRRPGKRLYVLDVEHPEGYQTVESAPDRHFYGHGVFSHDGRWLYTTENRLSDLSGIIGIYDAANGFQRQGEWVLDGHGPHEVAMMPDGETLVIALGGIKTHPDSGRKTLNPDSLQPALLYFNRLLGVEVERQVFVDNQLSIRHLDVSSDGLVAIGMQYQGELAEPLPLVALHRRGEPLQAVQAAEEQWLAFNGYIASVCCLPEASTLAISSPRGNKVGLVDLATGKLKTLLNNRDCAGLARMGDSRLVVSNGQGQIETMECLNGRARVLSHIRYEGIQWDNHMIALG